MALSFAISACGAKDNVDSLEKNIANETKTSDSLLTVDEATEEISESDAAILKYEAFLAGEEKVYINLQTHGNTSSACIPTCLDELKKAGKIKDGMKICLVGFGAGLTSGAIVFEQ